MLSIVVCLPVHAAAMLSTIVLGVSFAVSAAALVWLVWRWTFPSVGKSNPVLASLPSLSMTQLSPIKDTRGAHVREAWLLNIIVGASGLLA
jgi:hypothetical protein